jgi:hypothetical protein
MILGMDSNVTSFETIITTSSNMERVSPLSTDQGTGHLSEPACKWFQKRTISLPSGKLNHSHLAHSQLHHRLIITS